MSTDCNERWWNERAQLHLTTEHYCEMERMLRAGHSPLSRLEKDLVGIVDGLRLLHLQCHLGHDTLAWAMMGAQVTGVDYSAPALASAGALARSLDLPARWVRANVCNLPASLGEFDRIVATHGVISWLADLQGWARGIRRLLAHDATLVIVDLHPLAYSLEVCETEDPPLRLRGPIMGSVPIHMQRSGSYADRTMPTSENGIVGWRHGLGDIVGALVCAGFVIDHLAEHSWSQWRRPGLIACDDPQCWILPPPLNGQIPLSFSLRARAGT